MEINIAEELAGIQSENSKIREQHFKKLLQLSEKEAGKIYQYWEIFVEILRKPEVLNKYYAIHLIANLCSADTENKFEKIFDEFFALFNHESPVVSGHIAGKSCKIINAKPKLSEKITGILLNIEKTSKCRQIELQKAYVISSLDSCYSILNNKNEITGFVKKQLNSESPKTRKCAKEFLARHCN